MGNAACLSPTISIDMLFIFKKISHGDAFPQKFVWNKFWRCLQRCAAVKTRMVFIHPQYSFNPDTEILSLLFVRLRLGVQR